MLSVVKVIVIMPSVIMINVVVPIVMAPKYGKRSETDI